MGSCIVFKDFSPVKLKLPVMTPKMTPHQIILHMLHLQGPRDFLIDMNRKDDRAAADGV